MPSKKPDFREIFSLENVKARFAAMNSTPRRGDYGAANGPACLIGSIEHALFGEVAGNKTSVADATKLPAAVVRCVEAGFEDSGMSDMSWDYDVDLEDGAYDFGSITPETQEEVDAYEWGHALGRILCDGATKGVVS